MEQALGRRIAAVRAGQGGGVRGPVEELAGVRPLEGEVLPDGFDPLGPKPQQDIRQSTAGSDQAELATSECQLQQALREDSGRRPAAGLRPGGVLQQPMPLRRAAAQVQVALEG